MVCNDRKFMVDSCNGVTFRYIYIFLLQDLLSYRQRIVDKNIWGGGILEYFH